MHITFHDQAHFDCPRLAQFINRTPTLTARNKVDVQFDSSSFSVELTRVAPQAPSRPFEIVAWKERDGQLSSITQFFNSFLPRHHLSTVEDLIIYRRYYARISGIDFTENTQWIQFLLPFTAVKNLFLAKEFAPGIAAALQGLVGDRITEVLPSLQDIFVEGLEPSGPFQKKIGQFVAARQLSGHPIAISAMPSM